MILLQRLDEAKTTNGVSGAKQEQEEPRICVTTLRKPSVMLCACVREGVSGAGDDGREACPSMSRIFTNHTRGIRGPHLEARKGLFIDPCSGLIRAQ